MVTLKVRQNTDMNLDVSKYESHKSYAQVFKVFVKVISCNVDRLECDSGAMTRRQLVNRSHPAVFLWGTGVDWGVEAFASVFTNL